MWNKNSKLFRLFLPWFCSYFRFEIICWWLALPTLHERATICSYYSYQFPNRFYFTLNLIWFTPSPVAAIQPPVRLYSLRVEPVKSAVSCHLRWMRRRRRKRRSRGRGWWKRMLSWMSSFDRGRNLIARSLDQSIKCRIFMISHRVICSSRIHELVEELMNCSTQLSLRQWSHQSSPSLETTVFQKMHPI